MSWLAIDVEFDRDWLPLVEEAWPSTFVVAEAALDVVAGVVPFVPETDGDTLLAELDGRAEEEVLVPDPRFEETAAEGLIDVPRIAEAVDEMLAPVPAIAEAVDGELMPVPGPVARPREDELTMLSVPESVAEDGRVDDAVEDTAVPTSCEVERELEVDKGEDAERPDDAVCAAAVGEVDAEMPTVTPAEASTEEDAAVPKRVWRLSNRYFGVCSLICT